ncbi:MAG: MnhB domain-containing protein [Halofilum sp. (in: g-proteobacteria)]|nr:MnhB domain-containing protein [Halofilum sp. (in: g-proteobacteria)]
MAIYALLKGMMEGEIYRKLGAWPLEVRKSADRHPILMVVMARVMLPLVLIVGVYIFLRGHNSPGGGFIAGLVVAIALVMQYMASGYGWAARRMTIKYHALIGGGVLIAATTGIGAMIMGYPFLTSTFDYFHLPVVGKFELASALGFDIGVFLTVVGGVMLALAHLSDLGRWVSHSPVNEQPMDALPTQDESGRGGN